MQVVKNVRSELDSGSMLAKTQSNKYITLRQTDSFLPEIMYITSKLI